MGFSQICQDARERARMQNEYGITGRTLATALALDTVFNSRDIARAFKIAHPQGHYLIAITASELFTNEPTDLTECVLKCSQKRFERYAPKTKSRARNCAYIYMHVYMASGEYVEKTFVYAFDPRVRAFSEYKNQARGRVISDKYIGSAPGYRQAFQEYIQDWITTDYLPGYYALCMTYDESLSPALAGVKPFAISRKHFKKLAKNHPVSIKENARYSIYFIMFRDMRTGGYRGVIQVE
jgi:hypothetical protein